MRTHLHLVQARIATKHKGVETLSLEERKATTIQEVIRVRGSAFTKVRLQAVHCNDIQACHKNVPALPTLRPGPSLTLADQLAPHKNTPTT